MNNIEAVLWDMDGVLVDSEPYWLQAREEFAQELGKPWGDAEHRLCMGRATLEWADVMREVLEVKRTKEDIAADIINRIIRHYERRLPLRPGAVEAVKLCASRYRVGLASGSPTAVIQRVLSLTGLDKVFEVVVFGDDIPNGKPAPDIYLEACKRLGVNPFHSAGIEDSGNGIRSLHAAGMKIIAAPTADFPLKPDVRELAGVVISELTEFSLELVAGLP